jgi:hypothetical protein
MQSFRWLHRSPVVPPNWLAPDAVAQVFRWLHRSPVAPRTGWHPMQSPRFSGGYIGGAPPVPIPNTAVKPSRADGTARFPCGRVGRCRNFSPDAPPRLHTRRGASFFGRGATGAYTGNAVTDVRAPRCQSFILSAAIVSNQRPPVGTRCATGDFADGMSEPLWQSVPNQICASDQPPSTPRQKRHLSHPSLWVGIVPSRPSE